MSTHFLSRTFLITLADGNTIIADLVCDVQALASEGLLITLKVVLYTQDLTANLLSVTCLMEHKIDIKGHDWCASCVKGPPLPPAVPIATSWSSV